MTSRAATAITASVAVAVTAVGLLSAADQIPSVGALLDSLGAADPGWLLAALAAEIVAVFAFALIQRQLVVDLGGVLSRRASVELALASGAISMALPAGTAFGAGYTYRRLRRSGLRPTDIGVTMLVSGALLTGTLLLLYLAVAAPSLLAAVDDVIGRHHTVVLLVVAGLLAVAATRARRSIARHPVPRPPRAHRQPRAQRPPATTTPGRVAARVREYAAGCVTAARSITGRSWRSAVGWAVVKWTADFAALLAATYAVGADVDPVALAGIYLGIQLLRQIPLTPGGLGVIEAALLAGLVAAGAAAAPAAAAVVIYRVLTFWLVLPAGAVAAVLDRGGAGTTASLPPSLSLP